jgi:hypothetical protein
MGLFAEIDGYKTFFHHSGTSDANRVQNNRQHHPGYSEAFVRRVFLDKTDPDCHRRLGHWKSRSRRLGSGLRFWEATMDDLWSRIHNQRSRDGTLRCDTGTTLPRRVHHIKLRSDSEYLVRGMQSLALRWKRHRWRNGRGLLLKDWKLWAELLELSNVHRIDWQ